VYIDLGGSHAGKEGVATEEEPANQMVSELHSARGTLDAKLQHSTVELLQVIRWCGLMVVTMVTFDFIATSFC